MSLIGVHIGTQINGVKWVINYSSPYTATNGVRQGGVLSPYLFAVYLDELSTQLGSARDALWEIWL